MQCKMKEYFFSFYTAEVQPILSKDSANRMQCKMKEYFFSFCTAEVQPILSKDSANRMQCKMKECERRLKRVRTRMACINRCKEQLFALPAEEIIYLLNCMPMYIPLYWLNTVEMVLAVVLLLKAETPFMSVSILLLSMSKLRLPFFMAMCGVIEAKPPR